VIIACTIDKAYVRQCATLLRSLRLATPDAHCEVYILHDGLPAGVLDRLTAYLRTFLDSVRPVLIDTAPLSGFRVDGHISLATYYRLLLPDALPRDVGRLLFLDCDMIVVESLVPLWDTALDGAPVGAVESVTDPENLRRLTLAPAEGYFNAGMLLIDLDAWRQRGVLREAKELFARHPERVRWHDQDLLNQVFRGQWHRLHPRWNALPTLWSPDDSFAGTIPRDPPSLTAAGGPAIVHFAGGGACKPWNHACRHPYRDDYRRIAATTPWGRGRLDGAPTLGSRVKAVLRPLVRLVRKPQR
jgi:lipopolysaccharide biosynthesis glycosyltransferase